MRPSPASRCGPGQEDSSHAQARRGILAGVRCVPRPPEDPAMTVHESAGGWQENDGLSRLGDRYLISRTELLLAEVGTRLGLFDELATHGPETCPELAERTGLDEGYIREWLA